MLFSQSFSRNLTSLALCALCASSLPAHAAINVLQNENILEASKTAQLALKDADSTSIGQMDRESLLACGTCGCEVTSIVAVESTATKHKDPSILTDSIWGNLILEMAYQRDKELHKITKKLNMVNAGTMAAIAGIALGTIGQSVVSLATLNPHSPETAIPTMSDVSMDDHDHASGGSAGHDHQDSYAPGIIGLVLSSSTVLTFATRMYFGHKYGKKLKMRQLAIKTQIEGILHHLEYSDSHCPDVHKELAALIGTRATGEFLQLWQSSHQLASTNRNSISMLKQINVSSSLATTP